LLTGGDWNAEGIFARRGGWRKRGGSVGRRGESKGTCKGWGGEK